MTVPTRTVAGEVQVLTDMSPQSLGRKITDAIGEGWRLVGPAHADGLVDLDGGLNWRYVATLERGSGAAGPGYGDAHQRG